MLWLSLTVSAYAFPPPIPVADAGELDADIRQWMREDPCSPINLAERLPERGMAMTLSSLLGFGAGHFYAKKNTAGGVFALAQVVSVGALAFGIAELREDPLNSDASALLWTGGVGLGFTRLTDIATAPYSAQLRRWEVLDRCGW